MSASKLDELTVDDFEDASDLTVAATPSRMARGTEPLQEAVCADCRGRGWIEDVGGLKSCSACGHTQRITAAVDEMVSEDDASLVARVDAIVKTRPPHERASLIAKLDAQQVELHAVCTVLLELEALVTRCGGFMRMEDQQVLFRARQMLQKHGRR